MKDDDGDDDDDDDELIDVKRNKGIDLKYEINHHQKRAVIMLDRFQTLNLATSEAFCIPIVSDNA